MPENAKQKPVSNLLRWAGIVGSLVVFALVVMVLFGAEDTVDVTRKETAPPAQVVSVIALKPAEATAEVSVFSELRPRWNAEIRAAVSGRVLKVHNAALAGTRVAAGTPLFEIERSTYTSEVAQAIQAVEQAELDRLHAENKVKVARRQFERDGKTPPNDLALNLPELRVAKRAVDSARAQLVVAQQQLANATVTAPFSGFVTQRSTSLGQTVSAGETLLSLSDDSQFELMVDLSQSDWNLLKHPVAGGQAQLFHRDGRPLGFAKIRQGGGFLDPKTRQVRVFLEVSDPAEGVLAGDFLRVAFKGRQFSHTLTLPETTRTRSGHIWFVDADDLLVRHSPDLLFRADGTITIRPPKMSGPLRVAKTPLASFLPGQRVAPQTDEG